MVAPEAAITMGVLKPCSMFLLHVNRDNEIMEAAEQL